MLGAFCRLGLLSPALSFRLGHLSSGAFVTMAFIAGAFVIGVSVAAPRVMYQFIEEKKTNGDPEVASTIASASSSVSL